MKQVVIIDDDVNVLETFRELVELLQFEVVSTGRDGKQAVELVQKFNPDFLLLDFMMPNYNGQYAIEEIKKLDVKTKIIVITGDITNETEKIVDSLDVHSFIRKPISIEDLQKIFSEE